VADFVIEPRAGGRWYEVGVDGTECDTGRVTAYEPPERLVLAWHLYGSWQLDPDPERASEVEVRFVVDGPSRTTVELEHRGFERHGDGAGAVKGGVEQGWGHLLELFSAHATGQPATGA